MGNRILQSTTDFVLEQKRPIPSADLHESDYYYQEYEILEKITQHAKTLKLKPELWMFVPTDENGNVLKETNRSTHTNLECEKYQAALSKVWFNGFEVIKYDHHYYLTYDKIAIYFFENGEVKLENKYNPYNINFIEDLTRHNLEITENFGK
jgi:hypothetical protein